jgi:hypothetical protein
MSSEGGDGTVHTYTFVAIQNSNRQISITFSNSIFDKCKISFYTCNIPNYWI